ncbi:MAG: hypothetical protein HON27_07105 [Candidatus Marinimicrobia bacterium]|jgi:hypothetical protein|nr:hypothetical protein [Candidatus Neomarinimicrobiota bacterium]MBT4945922.1 hypothetical protein [Candidatus Neomarinimicrobiota bacterium]MBT5271688.1 hypothetical protein [Candidatus Neomarinimicrobiota bacterium]
MLCHDEFIQDVQGRSSTTARLRFQYGADVEVIKAKSCAEVSVLRLKGYVLNPVQVEQFLGEVIYPDWGGSDNELKRTGQLIEVESNQASCYLVFQPVRS